MKVIVLKKTVERRTLVIWYTEIDLESGIQLGIHSWEVTPTRAHYWRYWRRTHAPANDS